MTEHKIVTSDHLEIKDLKADVQQLKDYVNDFWGVVGALRSAGILRRDDGGNWQIGQTGIADLMPMPAVSAVNGTSKSVVFVTLPDRIAIDLDQSEKLRERMKRHLAGTSLEGAEVIVASNGVEIEITDAEISV